jgi:hypothetical protein
MAGWYETLFVVPGFYRLHRLAESSPRNRFLGSLNVYKYGLRFKNQLQYVHPLGFQDCGLWIACVRRLLRLTSHPRRGYVKGPSQEMDLAFDDGYG